MRAKWMSFLGCIVVVATLQGCASAVLLDAKFDADPLGKPATSPSPNPPADNFIWTINNHVVSAVVADPAGGRRVRIDPKADFFPAPDNTRKMAMLAVSAPVSKLNVRGHADITIFGSADIVLGVMGMHGSMPDTNLGGAEVSGKAPGPGSVGSVTPNGLDHIGDPFFLPGSVGIAPYTSGQTIGVQWTVDQSAHTITVNALPGGTAQVIPYPASTGLTAIRLALYMVDPSPGGGAFVDNLSVEEY
jgi:hypothetical protein